MTEAELQAALESVADANGRLEKAITEIQRASKNLSLAEALLRTVLISIDRRGTQSWLDAKETAK